MIVKNALLIQTAFIGDVILTTPAIAAFKKIFPDARLSVLVKPEAQALLENNPNVDAVITIDKRGSARGLRGMIRMIRQIRSRRFDLLLSPHMSHRTSLLALGSRIPTRIGFTGSPLASIAYTKRVKRDMNLPEIERLLAFLEQATGSNLTGFSRSLKMYHTSEDEARVRELLRELDATRPILIAPSSVWATKRWTPQGFAQLIERLIKAHKAPVLIVGSQGDHPVGEEVLGFVRVLVPEWMHDRIHNVCGRTGLNSLYALMRQSRLLVSNDSAPVHVGCAAGIPVVAIFGPTTPSLGYAPIAKRTAVAELELPCRPCGTHGHRECPLLHFRCMKELTPDMVMGVVKSVML